jgi:uncharacterized protein YndB with AHSA1/START domain
MTTTAQQERTTTTQVYQVYIKTSPQKLWDAITKPEWTRRFGYGAPVEFDLRPGGGYRSMASEAMKEAGEQMGFVTPDVIIDGEVIESDPPNKLVQTWRMLMDPGTAAEPFTTITYEIKDSGDGVCRLTLVHELAGAPLTAVMVAGGLETSGGGGGWAWVLSDLKTLMETGKSFAE